MILGPGEDVGSFISEPAYEPMRVSMQAKENEEFAEELRQILAKPDSWYLERVDRAVRGATGLDRKHRGVPKKG